MLEICCRMVPRLVLFVQCNSLTSDSSVACILVYKYRHDAHTSKDDRYVLKEKTHDKYGKPFRNLIDFVEF